MPAALLSSIATVCLSGTLPEKLEAAAAAGFDAVEVFEPDLLGSPRAPREVAARAQDLGLSVALYQPFRDPDHVDAAQRARVVHRLHRKCEVARELGTDLLLVCSSVHPGAVTDDDELAGQLHDLAEVAAGHGVRLAYEALAWGTHVAGYRHSVRVTRAADHPSLGVCLDSFHILSRGDDPGPVADLSGTEVFFLQLADAPRTTLDVLPWSRHHRCFPGQGSFDLPGFYAAVLASGYRGPVSLEVFNDLFRQADPRTTAVDGRRSLLRLADQVAGGPVPHGPAGDGPPAGAGDDAADGTATALPTPRLPAAPLPGSWAFTEVTASPATAGVVEDLLRQLGFARAGRHRSSPVQLWTNGDVRVVLNLRSADVRARLSSLGLEVLEPEALQARARRLLAPVVNRSLGPAEAEIPSLSAPDGTWVQFCRSEGPGTWLSDFVPVTPDPGPVPGPVLTGVDHVALPQRFGEFDTAALFFASVLDLVPGEVAVIAGPEGLLRSRAMTSANGAIRVALNVVPTSAMLRGRPLGAGHIAFSTPDALAAARAFAARGGALLPVPRNYYDDLEARFDLTPEFLSDLRESSVLYDRDEDGELLHFFTRAVSRELFVEVLQRTGGYDGYGAANTPVRLAAQRG